jgi:hypothetical protein
VALKMYFHVSIDGVNSILYDLVLGTIQWSILGQILYAIFVAPMFNLQSKLSFGEDSFVKKCNKSLTDLIKSYPKVAKTIGSQSESGLFYKKTVLQ